MFEELIDGKYKIIKLLGKGGVGSVYLAQNINLETFWAIKRITKKSNSKLDIKVESNILKKLNHPSLPRIFDCFEDNEYLYLVVDFIDGESFEELLSKYFKFNEKVVESWILQILDVLNYLHNQKPNPIIYRDLKPGNIMLDIEGKIKLIDFGISREYKPDTEKDTYFLGTKGYAAPEQYGIGQTDERSDIYSLGILCYHLLTGVSPLDKDFKIIPIRQLIPDISEKLEKILIKCTMNNPKDRYQKIIEIIDEINPIYNMKYIEKEKSNEETSKKHNTLISIIGNHEFGCELSYYISEYLNKEVLLINLDFTNSKADLYLNLVSQMSDFNNNNEYRKGFRNLNFKKYINKEIFTKALYNLKENKKLFILSEIFKIENYKNNLDISLESLINFSTKEFEITIILVNSSIHDKYNILPMKLSNYNIISSEANLDEIRQYEELTKYMAKYHNVNIQKTRFVAFNYQKEINLKQSYIEEIFGESKFLGTLSYDIEREKSRNLNSYYSKNIGKTNQTEYFFISNKLGIKSNEENKSKISRFIKKLI